MQIWCTVGLPIKIIRNWIIFVLFNFLKKVQRCGKSSKHNFTQQIATNMNWEMYETCALYAINVQTTDHIYLVHCFGKFVNKINHREYHTLHFKIPARYPLYILQVSVSTRTEIFIWSTLSLISSSPSDEVSTQSVHHLAHELSRKRLLVDNTLSIWRFDFLLTSW